MQRKWIRKAIPRSIKFLKTRLTRRYFRHLKYSPFKKMPAQFKFVNSKRLQFILLKLRHLLQKMLGRLRYKLVKKMIKFHRKDTNKLFLSSLINALELKASSILFTSYLACSPGHVLSLLRSRGNVKRLNHTWIHPQDIMKGSLKQKRLSSLQKKLQVRLLRRLVFKRNEVSRDVWASTRLYWHVLVKQKVVCIN